MIITKHSSERTQMPRLKKQKWTLSGRTLKSLLFVAMGFIAPAWLLSFRPFSREYKAPNSHTFATQGTSGHLFEMKTVRAEISKPMETMTAALKGPLLDEAGHDFPMCDTWAVITSINAPTTTVKQLAAIPFLCVCVVADRKSPETYGLKNVVYLTPSIQVSNQSFDGGKPSCLISSHLCAKYVGASSI